MDWVQVCVLSPEQGAVPEAPRFSLPGTSQGHAVANRVDVSGRALRRCVVELGALVTRKFHGVSLLCVSHAESRKLDLAIQRVQSTHRRPSLSRVPPARALKLESSQSIAQRVGRSRDKQTSSLRTCFEFSRGCTLDCRARPGFRKACRI